MSLMVPKGVERDAQDEHWAYIDNDIKSDEGYKREYFDNYIDYKNVDWL